MRITFVTRLLAIAGALLVATQSARATIITPTSVSGDLAQSNGTSFNNLINGNGLSGTPTEATVAATTHVNQGFTAANHWLRNIANDPPAAEQMTFVLPTIAAGEALDTVHIWQYGQDICCTGRGTGSLQLLVSSDGTNFTSVQTISLNPRQDPALGTEPVQSFSFAAQLGVTHVRFDTFTLLTTGVNPAVGLGEVRFASHIIPEPHSLILLGLVGLGLMAIRRRRDRC